MPGAIIGNPCVNSTSRRGRDTVATRSPYGRDADDAVAMRSLCGRDARSTWSRCGRYVVAMRSRCGRDAVAKAKGHINARKGARCETVLARRGIPLCPETYAIDCRVGGLGLASRLRLAGFFPCEVPQPDKSPRAIAGENCPEVFSSLVMSNI